MRALILAAGEGVRLRPYTLDRPKCLVEVNGVTLLDRHLAVLRREGILDITLIGGYRRDKLEMKNLEIRVNENFAETNMVWSLFCAEELLYGDMVIAYGDIVYSREILQALLASKADISVAIDLGWESYWRARNENPLDDAETLRRDDLDRIVEIGQKAKSLDEIEGQYMGLMKFSSTGMRILRETFYQACSVNSLRGKRPENAYMTDLLQLIIDKGHDLQAVVVDAAWVEVDTVKDLESIVTQARLEEIAANL